MPTIVEPFPLQAHPVDLRLWVQDVILGWKTVEEVQQFIAENPDTLLARRIASLSLTRELRNKLVYELDFFRRGQVVVFSQFRDVLLDLQERLRECGVNMHTLFAGTQPGKRTRRLRQFHHTSRYPILGIHLRGELNLKDIESQDWIVVDDHTGMLFRLDLPGHVRICRAVEGRSAT